MTNPIYAQQAELAAARVDQTEAAMDPITIVSIITQVLPIIASCWTRNDSPDPAYAAEKFREAYADNPKKLRKRLARRIRGEADQPMDKGQSFVLADAIIQQMLETPDEVIVAGCNEAPVGL